MLAGALLFSFTSATGQWQHEVLAGDTLYVIAARYDTTIEELRSENRLTGDRLEIGQVLSLPGRPGFRIEAARDGETLADLARRFGLRSGSVLSANPGVGADEPLPEGTQIRVPPGDGVSFRLAAGKSLLEVAIEHGVAPGDLLEANGLDHLAQPSQGDWILLPTLQSELTAVPGSSDIETRVAEQAVTEERPSWLGPGVLAAAAPVPVRGSDWHAQRQSELLRDVPSLLGAFEPLSEDFVMPLSGSLSSRFGWRDISVGGNRFHGGIDLAVSAGTPVAAARDGVVLRTGWIGAYGYAVYIEHDVALQTRYAHLSQILVQPGEIVRQGDRIGLVGSTGASTGPHLHFEIRIAGLAVDPLPLLR